MVKLNLVHLIYLVSVLVGFSITVESWKGDHVWNENSDNSFLWKGHYNYTVNKPRSDVFGVISEWKFLDFEYSSYDERRRAITNGAFVPENNLPLGVDVFKNRIFITTPRWKDGVPASLGYIDYPPLETSPSIRPFPDWESHADPYQPDCDKLISVYRTSIDVCGRLWAIDSGIVNATISLNQICPPKILAFDLLNKDVLLVRYQLPEEQVKQDSLHSNILVDVSQDNCQDAYVYVTDVWRFGVVVFSLAKNRSWRTTNFNFSPNPIATDFNIYGLNFQWLDGVFGMSLSCPDSYRQTDDSHPPCNLYFHPMASFKEFMVSTSVLRDESLWNGGAQNVSKYFIEIGDRGQNGQSSTSAIAYNGVQFFTQVHRDAIACWDTAKPYLRSNIALLTPDDKSLIQFPNDLKVDKRQPDQGVWVMSNRLPIYLYGQLDFSQINFRILRADVKRIIQNNVCNPYETGKHEASLGSVYEGQCL